MGGQWSSADIPDLTGKKIVVTGGNRGLGYSSCVELAKKGAHVILTSREKAKGEAAIALIKKSVPNASLETMVLDCSSFESVRAFAQECRAKHDSLDVLMNNAGIGETQGHEHIETKDGCELTWQTNVWSACLLSQLLLPALANGATEEAPARIVFITSVTATMPKVRINTDDPEKENMARSKWWVYPNTKCADWMISNALHARLQESPLKNRVLAVCAHPGFSSTDMTTSFGGVMNALLGMPPSQGCLPQVRVATDPSVVCGAVYGPNTATYFSVQHAMALFGKAGHNREPELYGAPAPSVLSSEFAHNKQLCEKLLRKAENVIGAKFEEAGLPEIQL